MRENKIALEFVRRVANDTESGPLELNGHRQGMSDKKDV